MNKGFTTIGPNYIRRARDGYTEFAQGIKDRFDLATSSGLHLFTTNAKGLFAAFLDNLPPDARQHYVCNCCRHFVERYGNLAAMSSTGVIDSVMWGESSIPDFFAKSVKAMRALVLKSKVTGVFISSDRILGTPKTGEWFHMCAALPKGMVHNDRNLSASQKMAEKLQEYKMLTTALVKYKIEDIERALMLLQSGSLPRSEKCLPTLEWFKDLHVSRSKVRGIERENLVWLAVSTAPAGFCHISGSMTGLLLDDITSGLPIDVVTNKFKERMDPSNYRRAQAPPSTGGIKQAEKLIADMGLDLRRRYVALKDFKDIPLLWTGRSQLQTVNKEAGIFSAVVAKGQGVTSNAKIDLPSTVMTWEKFQRTVLPTADSLEVKVDNPSRLMALVTAFVEDAPSILQWNNPFSWYYHGGIDGEIKRRVETAGGRYENNEIRCSLIWEGYTDLDLHCTTPRREHIYFDRKRSNCDGWLDIDMNGGLHRNDSPVENIRWASNALSGRYVFHVHNYRERGKGSTPFKVELEVNGKIYTHNGVAGDTGFKIEVFNFNYVKGQDPIIDNAPAQASDSVWNVPVNGFVKVRGITTSPNLWGKNPVLHSGNHIFFLLDGCKDLSKGKGRGFFTEMLISELQVVRKTLEAYCAVTPIEGVNEASACGVGYSKDSEWGLTLRVKSSSSVRLIKIDRWD